MNRRYLFFTVFMGGMTTLAIEFTTSRMIQTVYGTSNLVWANVIGLVLFFLTLGYFLGGRAADRHPTPAVFYGLVSTAGVVSVVCLLLTNAFLKAGASALAAAEVGALVGSLLAVTAALALPITLLGCISPFAIRLGVRDVAEAGRVSGQIYAISTMGSLLGTYLPVLLLIPELGSRLTAVLFGSLLTAVGLWGLWGYRRPAVGLLLAFYLTLTPGLLWWTAGNWKQLPGQLFETESAYNYIQVIREGECNFLLLNEGQAFHSYYCDGGAMPYISVWGLMLAAPYFNAPEQVLDKTRPVQKVAVIGLAAGTIAKQYIQYLGPEIQVDGIEIDPAIVQAGRDYFDLTEPQVQVFVGDGRYELNQLSTTYDVITIDAYKVPYIPWHMTTVEYFQEVKAHLNSTGVVAINVGRAPEDRRLVEAMTTTLLEVFPSVHTVDVPRSLNTILFATVQPTSFDHVTTNLALFPAEGEPVVRSILEMAVESHVPTSKGEQVLFTDERAPVETMIDSLVLRYLVQEGFEGLMSLR